MTPAEAMEHEALAVHIADRSAPRHLRDDARQAAILGLLQAAEGFDASHGVAFGSYAAVAIRREVRMVVLALVGAGTTRRKAAVCQLRTGAPSPLFAPHAGSETLDALDPPGDADPAAAAEAADLAAVALAGIAHPIRRAVVARRCGLDGGGGATMPAIAAELGKSKQAIHATYYRGIADARNALGV